MHQGTLTLQSSIMVLDTSRYTGESNTSEQDLVINCQLKAQAIAVVFSTYQH